MVVMAAAAAVVVVAVQNSKDGMMVMMMMTMEKSMNQPRGRTGSERSLVFAARQYKGYSDDGRVCVGGGSGGGD